MARNPLRAPHLPRPKPVPPDAPLMTDPSDVVPPTGDVNVYSDDDNNIIADDDGGSLVRTEG